MTSYSSKVSRLAEQLGSSPTKEHLYQTIMKWGKKLLPFDASWKTEENRVQGCQSMMYLHSVYADHSLFFYATADALISAGLAALLIAVYSGETPEMILTTPPTFLTEYGILQSLSPGRSNGVASLFFTMQQRATQALTQTPF